MMRPAVMKAISLATMLYALVLSPAHAEVRILASPGGQVGPFLDLFERVRASGERVVIDGPCLSACTLVLSMVPGDRICVTRKAILGASSRRSIRPAGRRSLLHRAVDHPGNPKLVDAHAEALGEEGLPKRHVDAATLCQSLEPAFGIGGVLDLQ